MGIQFLNTYIRQTAKENSIRKIYLSELYGKTIAVDISIYLYRFLAEDALLENMYIMLSILKFYNIFPIFVFDGKAPLEKSKLLEKRYKEKKNAEIKYKDLENQLNNFKQTKKSYNTEVLNNNMMSLKKKFIRIKKTDVQKVKELITAFGTSYIMADGEADEVCAKLVLKKFAYACLSEDMDLFVYGCPRILRYLSLINQTLIIYYLDKILCDLDISLKEFKEICIISGTDYNYSKQIQYLNCKKSEEETSTLNQCEKIEYFEADNKNFDLDNSYYISETKKLTDITKIPPSTKSFAITNKNSFTSINKFDKTKGVKYKNNFYSIHSSALYTTLQYYKEYKEYKLNSKNPLEFYSWLDKNTSYIENIFDLYNIYYMFSSKNVFLKKYKIIKNYKQINTEKIKEIMIPEGFIFPN